MSAFRTKSYAANDAGLDGANPELDTANTANTAKPQPPAAPRKPELLAPAGDHASFLAALAAGADAVYVGVRDFNARRNAANFSFETLAEACDLAHIAGRRVYLTLNTAILPDEISRALDVAHQAWDAGIDALIVQDLGLLTRLSREMPQFELHASTQMNLHNAAGVRAAAKLGASRVTLARELSLEELSTLAQEGIPLEVFAHGALCVCYSGQCLFSSLIGRRSANRGLCAQACRLPYHLIDTSTNRAIPTPGEYLLSPADLATINILPALVKTGVASLKIEGRMKSAVYVAATTQAYRRALDELFVGGPGEQEPSRLDPLTESFSRGFTTAYLTGERGNSMMGYTRPNNRGVAVGRIGALRGGVVAIELSRRVSRGDRLELWTSRGRSVITLETFWATADTRGDELREAPENTRIYLRINEPLSPGDRVFRVRSAELFDDMQPLFDNTAFQGNNGIVALDAQVIARLGRRFELSFRLHKDASRGRQALKNNGDEDGPFEGHDDRPAPSKTPYTTVFGDVVEAARTKALSADDIRTHVGRVGGTPFFLLEWDIQLDDGVGMGFSLLHRLRNEALEALKAELLKEWRSRSIVPQEKPAALAPARKGRPLVAAIVRDSAGARAAVQGGAERIYIHSLRFEPRGQGEAGAEAAAAEAAGAEATGAPDGQAAGLPSPGNLPAGLPVARLLPAILHNREWQLLERVTAEGQTAATAAKATATTTATTAEAAPAKPTKPAKTPPIETAVINNLGEMEALKDAHYTMEAGPSLGICNGETLDLCARLGMTQAWLSPELSGQDIALLAPKATLPLALVVLGQQELMVTEHCLLMAQGPCDQRCATCVRRRAPRLLKDRKGYHMPVRTDESGRSHLFNAVPLDLIPLMPELLSLGLSTLVVDGTLLTTKELKAEVERAIRARDLALRGAGSLPKREGYTSGHFFRGPL